MSLFVRERMNAIIRAIESFADSFNLTQPSRHYSIALQFAQVLSKVFEEFLN